LRQPSGSGRGRWPRSLHEHPTRQSNDAPEWAVHVQGVALAEDWWFVTQEQRLWRFPAAGDVGDADGELVRSVGIPVPGIDHFGDCDYWDGRVYVAMEGSNPARVGVFDTDLELIGSAPVADQGTSNPWCAVDPVTGRLFSSPFDTDHLVSYELCIDGRRISLGSSQVVGLRGADGAPLALRRVQGGAFTPDGRLYLTVDSRDSGIVGVDVDTGRRMLSHRIEREQGWPDFHVVEGLAYRTFGDHRTAGIDGQLHVLVFSGAWEKPDYLWFRHYREQY
jgi:hypothetical protein